MQEQVPKRKGGGSFQVVDRDSFLDGDICATEVALPCLVCKKTCSDEQALIWESIFLGVFFGDCLSCLLQWLKKKKESVTGDPFAGWRGL